MDAWLKDIEERKERLRVQDEVNRWLRLKIEIVQELQVHMPNWQDDLLKQWAAATPGQKGND